MSTKCNRSACQETQATWWNPSTRAWYCEKCARSINAYAYNDKVDLCISPINMPPFYRAPEVPDQPVEHTGCSHSLDSNNKCMICSDPRMAALNMPDQCPRHGRYIGTNCTYCDWPPLSDPATLEAVRYALIKDLEGVKTTFDRHPEKHAAMVMVNNCMVDECIRIVNRYADALKSSLDKAPERESVTQALRMLHDMIDGGEECRGLDSEISDIIRLLEQGR